MKIQTLNIPPSDGRIRGVLYDYHCITQEHYDEEGNWIVSIRLPLTVWNQLDKRYDGAFSQCDMPNDE